MYKLFLDGEELETVMIDDAEEFRRYLMNKYWIDDVHPTYVWVGKTVDIEGGD